MTDDYVFKSSDIRLSLVDGSRTGEKETHNILLAGADLSIEERRNTLYHKDRGGVSHRRPETDFPLHLFFSWRYANADIYLFIRDMVDGTSTSAPGGNLCSAPYDYTASVWTKTNIAISDNGLAPDGMMTAKRLTPSIASGNIAYSVTYSPALQEWAYVDWWAKGAVAHQAKATVGMTYHGGGPTPPDWNLSYNVTTEWQKFTAGIQNTSDILADETLTVTFWPTFTGTNVMDLWEVYIRRDIQEVKTWDLYVDVYKDDSISRTIIVEHVAHKDISFVEGETATIWSARFDSLATEVKEIVY